MASSTGGTEGAKKSTSKTTSSTKKTTTGTKASTSAKKNSSSASVSKIASKNVNTNLSKLASKSTKSLSQAGVKNAESVVSSVAKVSAATSSSKSRSNPIRYILFALISIIMLVTLPFSGAIESGIRGAAVSSNIMGAFNVVSDNELVVHFVDVGQGDCIMLELPDGKTMIIDGGNNRVAVEKKIIDYANENIFNGSSSKVFDYMIATHSDTDHIGGIDAVLNAFEVKTIYRPKAFYKTGTNPSVTEQSVALLEEGRIEALRTAGKLDSAKATMITTDAYAKFLNLAYTETWGAGNPSEVIFHEAGIVISGIHNGKTYDITFYAPNSSVYHNGNSAADINNLSAVVAVEYNGRTIMLTGDAHSESEAEMVASIALPLPKVDALKLGHHGSDTSTSLAFLTALDPTYVFICVGEGNSYKHPTESVLTELDDYGINSGHIFRSDLNGDILFGISAKVDTSTGKGTLSIAVSKGEVFVVYIEWWQVVLGVIALAGVILIVPAVVTRKK